MKYRKPAVWAVAAAVLLCVGLTACLAANPRKASNPTPSPAKTDATPAEELEKDAVADVSPEPADLQAQLTDYIASLYDQAYRPYYEGLRYEMTDYQETLDGEQFTATFLWTMHFRDTGADVSSDSGKETQANTMLQATGALTDGVISSVEVLVGVGATGPIEYTVPLETYFPNSQSVLVLNGYITSLDPDTRRLEFDQVFYLTAESNDDQLRELGVVPDSLPNGYYLYNPEEEVVAYGIAEEAVYRILDRNWESVETDLDTFAEDLNTRTPLYTITVENGVVTELAEHYLP